MKEAEKQATNPSGITPSGDRVIVKPDEIETVTAGGIVIPDTEADKYAGAQSIGTLVAVGPDAWLHDVEKTFRVIDNTQLKLIEVKKRGYSQPFAVVGDRVAFAKYGGLRVEGEDGSVYRILNDEDITAVVSEDVNFTDIKSRNPLGAKK